MSSEHLATDGGTAVEGDRPPAWKRLALGVAWAAAGKALVVVIEGLPVLSLLGLTSLTFVTGSILLGWLGLVGVTLVQVTYTAWRLSSFGLAYGTSTVLAYALAGALAWSVFHRAPGLDRGFSSFRTIRWYALAAAVGSVLSATVISWAGSVADLWASVAVWSRSTLVTLWVFGPPLVILGHRALKGLLAPIPGEREPESPREIALVTEPLPGEALAVAAIATRGRRGGTVLVTTLGATLVIAAGRLAFGDASPAVVVWWNVLYFGPIYYCAQRLRVRGGLLAAGIVGICSLIGDALVLPAAELPQPVLLATYGQLLLYWIVGALLGRAAQREGRLVESLADSYERLEQDLQRVVLALTGALEAKDQYTGEHLQRVNAYALDVGRELGLPDAELELVRIAGTLHDIGKIGIPEQVLNKPGPLSEQERRVMQRHPEIGARILARLDGLKDAAPIVLGHQERWDGRRDGEFPGYPAGLSGEGIPLGARIIAVVDAFDAMTTDRPYRRAMPPEKARQALERERGHQFDPRVVDAFLSILEERPWR